LGALGDGMRKETRILIVASVLSFFLLWALSSHPYSYYMNLRNALLFGGGYLAYELRDQKKYLYLILLMVALFNPISPFRFEKETWGIFNIASAILLILIAWHQSKLIRGSNN
jgi:hypothetical protein